MNSFFKIKEIKKSSFVSLFLFPFFLNAASGVLRKMPQVGQKEDEGIIPYKAGGPVPRNVPEPTPPTPPNAEGRFLPSGETEPAYLIVEEAKDEKGKHLKVKQAHPQKGAPYKEGDKIYGPIDGKTNPLPEGLNK
jgi:hypothetical protein